MLCGLGIQTAKGYRHYELGLYVEWLFGLQLVDYWLVCVLALVVHSLVNQKYLGHLIMIVYFIALSFSDLLGYEHNLYKYGANGNFTYSDMNGFGHFLKRIAAFDAYWAAAARAAGRRRLPVLGPRHGQRLARAAADRPRALHAAGRAVTAAGAVAMAGFGAYIFYNTNILNTYVTTHDREQRQADYEKQYKSLANRAAAEDHGRHRDGRPLSFRAARAHARPLRTAESQRAADRLDSPAVPAVRSAADQYAAVHGTPRRSSPTIAPRGCAVIDSRHRSRPEATLALDFDLEIPTQGFTNAMSTTDVVYNGSFINGQAVLPVVGYDERGELVTDRDRKKFGLAPKERMRPRDDPVGLQRNGLAADADFIAFDATVGTEPDQFAIAPGYLQREWTENGRRYFHYRMDSPILNFFAFQSARYAVRNDRWNDVAIDDLLPSRPRLQR